MIAAGSGLSELPTLRKQSQSLFLLNRNVVAIGIGVAVLLAVGGGYSLRMLRAASVLRHFDTKPWVLGVYEHFFASHFDVSDTSIPGTSGPVELRIYTPIGVKNPAPIVLVHGFARDGNRNAYLSAFASRFASVGFQVFVPTVPAASHDQMLPSDLVVIDDVIRWTAHKTGQQVAVFGISFGAGMVIPAAAQRSVAGDVKMIVSFSGYNDLESIARYYLHERVNDPSGNAYVGQLPGPLFITSPYLKELIPLRDVPAISSAVNRLDDNGGHPLPPDDPALLRLNSDQRQEFDELQKVNTARMRQLYMDALARHSAEMAAISPSSVVKDLRIPLFALHGTNDPTFPEGEIEWMRQEAAGNPNVHIFLSPWFTHVAVGRPATMWEKLRVINFCSHIFSQVAIKTKATG
jgi:pimeloyl-ACP methyl ester carboxylesterase